MKKLAILREAVCGLPQFLQADDRENVVLTRTLLLLYNRLQFTDYSLRLQVARLKVTLLKSIKHQINKLQ
jgi:hypothetical protein